MKRRLVLGAVAIALGLSGCSDDGDDAAKEPAPPAAVETPDGNTTPPTPPGQLPPEFVKCMADEGFEIKSPDEIHSAPPEVLQKCFGALHSSSAP